jgi:two-component system, cell cycle sensor histidine kinase and response regulator CckA
MNHSGQNRTVNRLREELHRATVWQFLGRLAHYATGSIRRQVIVLAVLAMLPAAGLVFYNGVQARRRETEAARNEARQLALQAADHYERVLNSTQHLLSDLADRAKVDLASNEDLAAAIDGAWQKNRSLYYNIALIGRDGTVLVSAAPLTNTVNVADRPYFQQAIANGEFSVGEYQIGRITQKANVGCAYPIRNRKGEICGVVYAALNLEWFYQLATNLSLPRNSDFTLLDHKGIVLAHYPNSFGWAGRKAPELAILNSLNQIGALQGTGIEGEEQLYGYAALKSGRLDSGLRLYVGIPLSVAYARANSVLLRSLTLVFLVALLAVLTGQAAISFFMNRYMLPVISTAEKFTNGELAARCGPTGGPVELRRLASTLDQMAESLQNRQLERERAEKLLRESEERFRSLTASSPVGILLTDPEGHCIYANPRCRTLLGITLMKSLGEGWSQALHPDDRAAILQEWHSCVHYRREFLREVRLHGDHGTIRWAQIRSATMLSEVSDLRGHVLVVDDITERKQAEDRLHLQSRALESAANGIVITDQNGHIVWVNPAFTELTGYTVEEAIGRNPRILKSGKHDEVLYKDLWGTIKAGKIWRGEMVNKRKDETLYTEELSITPVHDQHGTITHFIAIKQDITKRKQAEIALRQSEKRYRDLVDSARDVIFTLSTGGECLSLNPAFESITGRKLDEWIGKPFVELVDPRDQQIAFEYFWKVIHGEHPEPFELRFPSVDGKTIIGEITVSPQHDDGQTVAVFGVARDVTERKQLQNELHHRQQMEAVGRLAGGIAHDFNNILTAITGYSELTLFKLDNDDPLRRNLEEIYRASGRAAALTHQLLAFSRKQVLQPRVIDLNTVVAGIQKMLGRLIGENIELHTLLCANPGWVKADPTQLEQVLINLVVNARDAMPTGGRLTIETSNAVTLTGHSIVLTVSDTGMGMSEEVKQHIFEPFFTTKPQGQGTGLGLATCFGIVQQSGGRITVESSPGRGAKFQVHLPQVSAPSATAENAEPVHLPTGTETILVAEDEAAVREFAAGMLRELGYRVLVAHNGEEGCRMAEEYKGGRIHLLFTDVVMPQMGGRELADWFHARRPDTKVLFTTGYTTDQQVWSAIREGRSSLLEKPFTPAALASKVREILDHRS